MKILLLATAVLSATSAFGAAAADPTPKTPAVANYTAAELSTNLPKFGGVVKDCFEVSYRFIDRGLGWFTGDALEARFESDLGMQFYSDASCSNQIWSKAFVNSFTIYAGSNRFAGKKLGNSLHFKVHPATNIPCTFPDGNARECDALWPAAWGSAEVRVKVGPAGSTGNYIELSTIGSQSYNGVIAPLRIRFEPE